MPIPYLQREQAELIISRLFFALVSTIARGSHSLWFPSLFSYHPLWMFYPYLQTDYSFKYVPFPDWLCMFINAQIRNKFELEPLWEHVVRQPDLGSPLLWLLEPRSPFLTCSNHRGLCSAPGHLTSFHLRAACPARLGSNATYRRGFFESNDPHPQLCTLFLRSLFISHKALNRLCN